MDNEIIVKVAQTPESMEAILEVRRKVFVLEQNVSEEEEYDEYELSSTHLFASVNNQIVGTCRYRSTLLGIKLERFAVLQDFRSMHVGSALLSYALEKLDNRVNIYLHAQIQVVDFYKKFGFTPEGDQFTEANIQHFKMGYSPTRR